MAMSMQAQCILRHLQDTLKSNFYSDTEITFHNHPKRLKVHRAIITMSGYFKACLEWSKTQSRVGGIWAEDTSGPPAGAPRSARRDGRSTGQTPGPESTARTCHKGEETNHKESIGCRMSNDSHGSLPFSTCAPSAATARSRDRPPVLEHHSRVSEGDIDRLLFEIDLRDAPGSCVSPDHVEACINYLYGERPALDHHNSCGVLLAAAFLDIPPLLADVCEWVFHNVTPETAVDYLHFVQTHELGPSGNSIRDASVTLIRRHTVELLPSLLEMPLAELAALVMGSDAFFSCEHVRHALLQQVFVSLKHKFAPPCAHMTWTSLASHLGRPFLPLVMDVPETLATLRAAGWTVTIPLSVSDALFLAPLEDTTCMASIPTLGSRSPPPPRLQPAATATQSAVLPLTHQLTLSVHRSTRLQAAHGVVSSPHHDRMAAGAGFQFGAPNAPEVSNMDPGRVWGDSSKTFARARAALSRIRTDWAACLSHAEASWFQLLEAVQLKTPLPCGQLDSPLVKKILELDHDLSIDETSSFTTKLINGICSEDQAVLAKLHRVVAWQILQPGNKGLVRIEHCRDIQVINETPSSTGLESLSVCSQSRVEPPMNVTVNQPGRSSPFAIRSSSQASKVSSIRSGGRETEMGSHFSQSSGRGSAISRPSLSIPLFSPPAARRSSGGVSDRHPASTSMSSAHWGQLAIPDPVGSIDLVHNVLDRVVAAAIFQIRFVHMDVQQLKALKVVAESRDSLSAQTIPAAKVQEALWLQSVMKAKVQEAATRGFDQLSFLSDIPSLPLAVRCQRMPSARFGVCLQGVLSEGSSPGSNGNVSQMFSSSHFVFMGSRWNLDVKRQPLPDGDEMLAVYLRRSLASFTDIAGVYHDAAAFVDERASVRMGFGIRLCGGPGSPTINSIGGRSSSGKSFGIGSAHSWGWDNFLLLSKLTPEPWALGDTLRFVVTLTPL